MRFWIREILGWLLVLVGLLIFYLCVVILLGPHDIVEAMPLSVIGIVVFRGGIHLLKVAVAARIAMQTQAKIAERPVQKRPGKTETPWDW